MTDTRTVAFFGKSGIGNFILFTPALRAMASMDPSGQLDICCHDNWKDSRKNGLLDIWEKLPFVQNVICLGDRFTKKYKTWFWVDWLCVGEGRELFASMKNYDIGIWDHNKTHESDHYFEVAQRVYGYKGWKPSQLIVPADNPVLGNDKIKIVLCNGGFGELQALKKWEGFKQLAHEIKMLFGNKVSLIKVGYKNELEEVDSFDIDFVNKLSITQTAKVIQQADLMISTDTGNMHIADALGTPMIVLWGGSSIVKNKPYNSMSKIIHLGLKCQPCQQDLGYISCKELKCMTDISVGEVMYYVREFINNGRFNG